MKASPRIRRLKADRDAVAALAAESTIFEYSCLRNPPEIYNLVFRGRGLWRMPNNEIVVRDTHEIQIKLPATYPRLIPTIVWRTPIFHPNISTGGVVCLGGYGTHWVPSLTLDELCTMLWDMIRYKNFDTASPYNKTAAQWTMNQVQYTFPLDDRSIRDKISGEELSPSAHPIRNVQPPPVATIRPPHQASTRGASGATGFFSGLFGSGQNNRAGTSGSSDGPDPRPPIQRSDQVDQDDELIPVAEAIDHPDEPYRLNDDSSDNDIIFID